MVKKYAEDRGVDLTEVQGSGKNGSIRKVDVDKAAEGLVAQGLDPTRPEGFDVERFHRTEGTEPRNPWKARADAFDRELEERRQQAEEKERERRGQRRDSRPWTAADKSWKIDRLKVPAKPGFVHKWWRRDRCNDACRDLGWQPASAKERGYEKDPRFLFGTSQTDLIEVGNLVLLECPQEVADSRRKVMQAMTMAQTADETQEAIAAGLYERGGNFGKMRKRAKVPVGRSSSTIGSFND